MCANGFTGPLKVIQVKCSMFLLFTSKNFYGSCLRLDVLQNSTTAVRTVLESFLRSQHKDLITKTVGKILIEALTLREVRCINVKTSKLLVRAVSSVSKLRVSSKVAFFSYLCSCSAASTRKHTCAHAHTRMHACH